MDIAKYQELTGITVPAGKQTFVTAQIARATSMLETMLGYTLNPDKVSENLYNELGQTNNDCACPSAATQDESLKDPDAVTGAYRLFPYNTLDPYLHIDPFKKINKVKLVFLRQGENVNGVTLKTFTDSQVRLDIGRDGIGKYLEICRDCMCECSCTDCIQLAVDADWLWCDSDDIPLDLLYILSDMVTFYSNPKKDIKSESITTHSYTRFENKAPEMEPSNLSIIKGYAGPFGTVTVMPTTGGAGRRY